MKKIISFLMMLVFFCLSSVSYADKYGDFIELLDDAIKSNRKISCSNVNLSKYKLAYDETISFLKEISKTTNKSDCSNCFGFDDVVDCTPIYCSRLKFLCSKENKTLQNAIKLGNIKRLDDALNECGLSEDDFVDYLSGGCF